MKRVIKLSLKNSNARKSIRSRYYSVLRYEEQSTCAVEEINPAQLSFQHSIVILSRCSMSLPDLYFLSSCQS